MNHNLESFNPVTMIFSREIVESAVRNRLEFLYQATLGYLMFSHVATTPRTILGIVLFGLPQNQSYNETKLSCNKSAPAQVNTQSKRPRLVDRLLGVSNWEHILDSLISTSKIVLHVNVILDLEEHNRGSDEKRDAQKDPVADELLLIRQLVGIKTPHNRGACRLNSLVKADIVGRAATGVGESTHVPGGMLVCGSKTVRRDGLWAQRGGGVGNIPVDSGLPDSIVETVEEVEEHGADETRVSPVLGLPVGSAGILSRVLLLKGIAAAPDDEGESEEDTPGQLGTDGTAEQGDIQEETPDTSGDDLCKIVEETVEGVGAGAEEGAVDGVLLVRGEPVRGEEHGEEEDDERLEAERLPQAQELAGPARVLHENDTAAILSHDVVGIAEHKGEDGTETHQDDEANVSTISDVVLSGVVDVLAKRNLYGR